MQVTKIEALHLEPKWLQNDDNDDYESENVLQGGKKWLGEFSRSHTQQCVEFRTSWRPDDLATSLQRKLHFFLIRRKACELNS